MSCRMRHHTFLLKGMTVNHRPSGLFSTIKIKNSKIEKIDFEIVVLRNPEP